MSRRPIETEPHGDVLIGELLAGSLGGGIDRGSGLVDHFHDNVTRQAKLANEGLSFTSGGTVTYGDDLDIEFEAQ